MGNKIKNNQETQSIWPVVIFLTAVFAAFTFGEVWMGIVVTIIGLPALGWSKRHEGPFPTNRNDN